MRKTTDDLGRVLAQITDLEKIETSLKGKLKSEGDGAYEGDLFRATVSTAEIESLDKEAMILKLRELGVSHQWFAANTNRSVKTVVKVVARNGVEMGPKTTPRELARKRKMVEA